MFRILYTDARTKITLPVSVHMTRDPQIAHNYAAGVAASVNGSWHREWSYPQGVGYQVEDAADQPVGTFYIEETA